LPVVAEAPADWSAGLTEREREVARAVASGASNKEIARRLGITERSVKAHTGAIFEKLGVRDRLQLSLVVHGRRPG
jgi:DNA-binding NarL/FixJ family response regulator